MTKDTICFAWSNQQPSYGSPYIADSSLRRENKWLQKPKQTISLQQGNQLYGWVYFIQAECMYYAVKKIPLKNNNPPAAVYSSAATSKSGLHLSNVVFRLRKAYQVCMYGSIVVNKIARW